MTRWGLALMVIAGAGCLPDDQRPPPGELLVVAEASQATQDGVVHGADGATYTFELAALTLGAYLIEDEHCAPYSFTYYDWLTDYAEPGPHKIALLFGLGDCRVGYDTFAPDEITVLGAGVDESLPSIMDDANLYVEGYAELDGEQIGFRWRVYWPGALTSCLAEEGSVEPVVTPLDSGDRRELALTLRFEEVVAVVTFEQLRQSDLDGDGIVSELELNIISPGIVAVGDGLFAPAISRLVTARDGWVCPTAEPY